MSEILQGERVFFPDDQFEPQALQLLEQKAMALGAEVVADRDTATITIVNPRSLAYAKSDRSKRSEQRDAIPYHWLSTCLLRQTRVALSDLAVPVPLFVHPDRSKDHAPLKVWVSINIHRAQGEVPQEAQATVTRLFEERGALALPKRAHADVLVVDKESKFYATVIKEMKEHGRDGQKVVQRDWVEDCVNTGKLGWAIAPMAPIVTSAPSATAEGQDKEKDNDSFEDEPVMPRGRGPGRPAGKPRIEYTPEDDEFLVRYLAAHFPFGAWGSRKTYSTLAASAAQYPIAERHSDQSWHERFKKNSTTFSKRVEKFIRAGVDASLKTTAEREKAREKEQQKQEKQEKQEEQEKQVHRHAEVSREARAGPSGAQAGPSSLQPAQAAASPARGATATSPTVPSSNLTNRRMLVSADADDEAPASRAAAPVHQNGHKREARAGGVFAAPEPTETRAESRIGAPAPDQHETVVVVTESIPPLLDSVPISEERRLRIQESREEQLEIERTLLVVQQSLGESLETQGSNGHEESLVRAHGEETQALLGDFARARQEARAAAAATTQVAMGEHRAEAPVSAGETTIGAVPVAVEEAVQPPSAVEQPRRNAARRRAHETESTAVAPEAPSPSHRRRSALQAELDESTAKRSKRSSVGTSPHRRPRPSSPDRIAARAIVPPPRQTPLQQSTGQAQGSSPSRRASIPAERLTPRQHAESVLRGQQLVLEQRDRYRAKIAEYEKKYGLTAKEVLEEVRKLRVKSGSWDVIDAGLRERFGW